MANDQTPEEFTATKSWRWPSSMQSCNTNKKEENEDEEKWEDGHIYN
jgi:hypothetical protein